MKNSRAKGSAGERELSHKLNDIFGTPCRRAQQYCGVAGNADLIGLDGIHIECKRVEKLVIDNAIAQAVADAKGGDVPVVMHRRNRGDWLVTVRLDDLPDLIDKLAIREVEGV